MIEVRKMTYAEKAIQAIENHLLDEARENIDLSIQKDTEMDQVQLAEILFSKGFIQDAKKMYEYLLTIPEFAEEAKIRIAEIFIEEGADTAALDILLEVPKESPHYVEALLVLADLYQTQGLYEVSRQKLQEASMILPNEPVIHFALGELLFEIGQYPAALSEYEKLSKAGLNEFAGINLKFRIAESNSLIGRWDKAEELYLQILEKKGSPEIYFQLGLTYVQKENYESAIKYLTQLKDIDSYFTSLYPVLIKAHEELGQLDEALLVLEEGLANDQTNPALYVVGAKLHQKKNHGDQAVRLLQEALLIDPRNDEARLLLSDIMEQQDDLENAIEILDEDDMDANPMGDWRKATVYEELEEFEEAGKLYKKAAPFLSDNEEFINDYIFYLRDEGNWEELESVFSKAKSQNVLSDETREFIESFIRKE